MSRRWVHRVLERSDVAAIGFAVADGTPNARVSLRRDHDGTWRVLAAWARDGWDDPRREKAISVAVAIVCGANLTGLWTCSFVVDDEVGWVNIRRHGHCVNLAALI